MMCNVCRAAGGEIISVGFSLRALDPCGTYHSA
jgi:hypothetical protein